MRYCKPCERDLADTFETCPFCHEDTIPKPMELMNTDRPSAKELSQKATANTVTNLLKVFGLGAFILIFGGISYFSRMADSPLPLSKEWHFLNSFFRVTGGEKDWGMLPQIGIIRTREDVVKLIDTCRFRPQDPFYREDAWEIDIDPDDIDFSTSTLVYFAETLDSSSEDARRIEAVTENFRNTWILVARSPLIEDEKSSLRVKAKQLRVQTVYAVVVEGDVPDDPTLEELSRPHSRPPKTM